MTSLHQFDSNSSLKWNHGKSFYLKPSTEFKLITKRKISFRIQIREIGVAFTARGFRLINLFDDESLIQHELSHVLLMTYKLFELLFDA
jgi:hypothetical protein